MASCGPTDKNGNYPSDRPKRADGWQPGAKITSLSESLHLLLGKGGFG